MIIINSKEELEEFFAHLKVHQANEVKISRKAKIFHKTLKVQVKVQVWRFWSYINAIWNLPQRPKPERIIKE